MGIGSSKQIITYEEACERLGAESSLHEDGFRRICDSHGFIDSTTFYVSFLRSLIPSISVKLADAIFRGFDTRKRQKLDVKDFVCAMGVILRGTTEERLKLLFKMYQTTKSSTIDPRDIETYLMEMSKGKWSSENSTHHQIYSKEAIRNAVKDLLDATGTKETTEDGELASAAMSFDEFRENFEAETSVFAWMRELEKQIRCSTRPGSVVGKLRPSPSTESLSKLKTCLKCGAEKDSHTRSCVQCGRTYCGTCKKIVMSKEGRKKWQCISHEEESKEEEDQNGLKKIYCAVKSVPSGEVRCLAELSRFSETQVVELKREFTALRNRSITGDVDFVTLKQKFCPPMTENLLRRFFETLDKDESGTISLREFVLGLSICCAGTVSEQWELCFALFDRNGDGKLNKNEIRNMLLALYNSERIVVEATSSSPSTKKEDHIRRPSIRTLKKEVAKRIDQIVERAFTEIHMKGDAINEREWTEWARSNITMLAFVDQVRQVTFTALGVRPRTGREESEIVRRRWNIPPSPSTSGKGQLDTEWNLVPYDWWTTWCRYSGFDPEYVDTESTRPRTRSKQDEAENIEVLSSFLDETDAKVKVVEPPVMLRQSSKGEGPPPLSFAPLLSSNGRLRNNLKLNEDYVLVSFPVWSVLQGWYGGETQRGLRRRVVRLGKKEILEMYPLRLGLYTPNRFGRIVDARTSLTISASSTSDDVLREACRLLYRNPEDCCIFFEDRQQQQSRLSSKNRWIVAKDEALSLFELGIESEQNICIQSKKNTTERSSSEEEEKEDMEESKSGKPGKRGLANLGNTCYMNASLQCLSNTRLLRDYCVSENWMYDLCDSPTAHRMGMAGKIGVVFCKTIAKLWDEKSNAHYLVPRTFKKYMGNFKDTFKGNDQQDAHELLSQLLCAFHEDTNRVHDKPGIEPTESQKRPDSIVANEWRNDNLRRNFSIITQLFTGQLKTCSTCLTCKSESSRFDPFTFIQVPLPDPPFRYVSVLIHFDGNARPPLKVSVKVSREGSLDDVLQAVEDLKITTTTTTTTQDKKMAYVLAKDCRIANIMQHFIMTFVNTNQGLTRIGRGAICVFHLLEKGSSSETKNVATQDASNFLKDLVISKTVEVVCPRNAHENGQLAVKAPDGSSHIVTVPKGVLPGTRFNVTLTVVKPEDKGKEEEENKEDYVEEEKKEEEIISAAKRLEQAYIDAAVMLDKTDQLKLTDKIDVNLGGVKTANRTQVYGDKWFRGEIVKVRGDGSYDVKLRNMRNTVYEGAVRGENRSGLARLRRHVPEAQTVLCVHRRLVFQQHYFLNPWCLRTFGRPHAVRANLETVTVRRFYELVWDLVKRYVPDWDPELHTKMISLDRTIRDGEEKNSDDEESPDPNTPPHPGTMNRWVYRGKDGILPYDGIEYEKMLAKYPFRLSLVKKDGSACSACNVLQACSGCLLPPLNVLMDDVVSGEQASVSIDWSPKAIREFYNQKRAALIHTHDTVKKSLESQKKPCLLTKCLEEFAKVNEITKFCSTCTKKNGGDFTETKHSQSDEVWAVPPYLMFQIKRFKAYGQHSYKLGNLVKFPIKDFNIHPFLAKEMHALDGDDLMKMQKQSDKDTIGRCEKRLRRTIERRYAKELKMKPGSSELAKFQEETKRIVKNAEITEDMLKRLPKSLTRGKNNTMYDLYAVCHQAGTLRGGHYYAHSLASDKKTFLCFDDKKVESVTDMSKLISPSAYILFYARRDVQDIDLAKIYPSYFEKKRNPKDILSAKWKKPKGSIEDENEKGMLRNCAVM